MMEVTPSLSERSISPMVMATNQRKAALREKQDSKEHKIFSIKFIIIVWSSTQKYGKLIDEQLFQVVFILSSFATIG